MVDGGRQTFCNINAKQIQYKSYPNLLHPCAKSQTETNLQNVLVNKIKQTCQS